jgi:hypothetical protein
MSKPSPQVLWISGVVRRRMIQSETEPKAFQLCFEILQYEHENTPNSLQFMLASMNQLPSTLEALNENNLFKVLAVISLDVIFD